MTTEQCKHEVIEVLSQCCSRGPMACSDISADGYGICNACRSNKAYFEQVCTECAETVGIGALPYKPRSERLCICGHPMGDHRKADAYDMGEHDQEAAGHFNYCNQCVDCYGPEVSPDERRTAYEARALAIVAGSLPPIAGGALKGPCPECERSTFLDSQGKVAVHPNQNAKSRREREQSGPCPGTGKNPGPKMSA